MIVERSEKTNLDHAILFLRSAQKSAIHIRRNLDQNNTIDISTLSDIDQADRPDPLRIPEVLIVIAVLLLWCGSILIFIRHSELLRIRHRDIPFRSSLKAPISSHHISVINRASDTTTHGKSHLSSISGLTPPTSKHAFHGYRNSEAGETISLKITPHFQKRRHTHSPDFHASSSSKYSSAKNNDKQHLLHPYRISSDIKPKFLNLQRENVHQTVRQSMVNLSAIKCSAFYSANDISRRRYTDETGYSVNKKRRIQESPV